ncbi:MAG: hypothetical protein A2487_20365 [Candidatus Raymondbacteria bacterium RifOxyC12_full_50_8]|uniref:DUF2442 domain-containing protein n=1 Tax=Candidatus Raymondbacteria bacterium RIFOXYD12_FULL_49_13 TaxID=1817890 RepID=A0A1F7FA39_UNCRA|nr:MAG: hypothetical protein A2248_22330 [Candidatus Raymondbacteria bacterium RIFOXYA2_FULL_49_16]OGJ94009.1 MAG: hypothetical protein A2350_19590 [Candidatus Raymondbacteria bacterium RifOxyB12_full_50_8]OGJ96431.1 MAG: hypothetical protein A2487_20365 [Candidatus Raymondbacteria bacterium RifOxyC12_full_50_8]OGK03503.1 MAG: hypothetical protein A2519_09725 [Candidatus Raymondbacteria bacterium RIFOXYD12_FULL_49_13]OGP42824.1 MAG: hypothetical protein A2324_16075 [Candidatus Raymondbacteria b
MYDLLSARYVSGRKIKLTFENGKSGIVDLAGYAKKGGVFSKFKETAYFKSFSIHPELKVLTWPGDVDIAPETLYHNATGEPFPVWMESA